MTVRSFEMISSDDKLSLTRRVSWNFDSKEWFYEEFGGISSFSNSFIVSEWMMSAGQSSALCEREWYLKHVCFYHSLGKYGDWSRYLQIGRR